MTSSIIILAQTELSRIKYIKNENDDSSGHWHKYKIRLLGAIIVFLYYGSGSLPLDFFYCHRLVVLSL